MHLRSLVVENEVLEDKENPACHEELLRRREESVDRLANELADRLRAGTDCATLRVRVGSARTAEGRGARENE